MERYNVSVIVPCYNVENTISRCIESVINQTFGFDNIELILVDDKSKDNTSKIIEEYSKKYDNIKSIILDENSGYPGKPRNVGIENASADYIMFLDGDDEYDLEICERLFKEIKEHNSDLVSCNFINIDSFGKFYCKFNFRGGEKINNKFLIKNGEVIYFKIGVVWSSIFKKSLIINNNITFPEDKVTEDGYFMIKYLLNAKKVVYLNKKNVYKKKNHENSTIHSMTIEKYYGLWDVLEECMDLFPKDFDLSYWAKWDILQGYVRLLTNNLISTNPKESYNFLKRIRSTENKINFNKRLMMPFNIINWFVLRGNFKIAFFLLKSIYIYKNGFLFGVYKKILSYFNNP